MNIIFNRVVHCVENDNNKKSHFAYDATKIQKHKKSIEVSIIVKDDIML